MQNEILENTVLLFAISFCSALLVAVRCFWPRRLRHAAIFSSCALLFGLISPGIYHYSLRLSGHCEKMGGRLPDQYFVSLATEAAKDEPQCNASKARVYRWIGQEAASISARVSFFAPEYIVAVDTPCDKRPGEADGPASIQYYDVCGEWLGNLEGG